MSEPSRIKWYRCKIDRSLLSELMQTSDARGFAQVVPQLTLFFTTGTIAYFVFRHVTAANWIWTLPLVLLALFIHGTFSSFMGMTGPVHELVHKTPFQSKFWNEYFLKIYAFLSWSDYVWFRASHVRHHQATVHADYDGEVVLPQKFDWACARFFAEQLFFDPARISAKISEFARAARGSEADWQTLDEWKNRVVPVSNTALRREHRLWARTVLFGHLILAAIFIATGHWFFILVFNFGTLYSTWFATLCGTPQHIGLAPNVPDFRLCCRTYTCSWLPAFLYWNMQYHVEHHMFPAVPFHQLPRLRDALAHDLPPAPHGLWATWSEILPILRRQRDDPSYVFVPRLPQGDGEQIDEADFQAEAAAS